MAADYFISLSKKLRFFCQLFSRVYLIIMFYFFSLEKMLETPKFSFLLVFFLFIISVNVSIFLHLFCETAVVFYMYVFLWNFVQEIGARQARIDSFAVGGLLTDVLLARGSPNLTHLRMFFV